MVASVQMQARVRRKGVEFWGGDSWAKVKFCFKIYMYMFYKTEGTASTILENGQ